jgi:RNA polymerase sigma-70 factor (ECF subfamily)
VDQPSDLQLIKQALQGESRAFDLLVLRYQDRLVHSLEHALCPREEALNAAQTAFLQAWTRLSTFRGESSFYAWLYRIARNAAITRRRRTSPAGSLNQLREDSGFEPADSPEHSAPDLPLQQNEEVARVHHALNSLSEEFRQPIVLREIDGLSYEEIGKILDIPLGTVRSRIFRARQELLERLERLEKDRQTKPTT